MLVDVPPDHREQSLRLGLERCDAILITHAHVDHIFGLDDVRLYNVRMRAPIAVHAEPTVIDDLFRVFRHIFERHRNANDSFVADLVPVAVRPGHAFDLFGIRVTPIRLLHGRLPILGYRFDAPSAAGDAGAGPLPLAYCTDTSGIPPETWPRLDGLRTLALDCLRERAHPTHFTLDQSLDAAGRIGADRTVFIHMTHDLRHAELAAKCPPGVEPGYDGLVLRGG